MFLLVLYDSKAKLLTYVSLILNMTEDFSPKALVVVESLLELLEKGGVAS